MSYSNRSCCNTRGVDLQGWTPYIPGSANGWAPAGGLSLLQTPYNNASQLLFPAQTCCLGPEAILSMEKTKAKLIAGTAPYVENFQMIPQHYHSLESFAHPMYGKNAYETSNGGTTNAWAPDNATCWTAGRGLGDNWGSVNSPNSPYRKCICQGAGEKVCVNVNNLHPDYNSGYLTEYTISNHVKENYYDNRSKKKLGCGCGS
ncbi:MAG: hypothetical protein CBD97_02020 [Pelagibacteraceae bacterium TMED237]|mgnify:CR=1 FL=1|nr:MAG: hypothetical protein CBD97_02020 [Pelagibacteraceae bacterium TMED237]|tara:strand:- start:3756 stop:4364 length:609 start_codon:yes stop_codon:yes gene_type:complete